MKLAGKLTSCMLAFTCSYAVAVDLPKADAQTSATTTPATTPISTGKTSAGTDNTQINQRDQGNATKTPQNQSNSEQDRAMLAAVRRAIVGDKTLSTMAHNVKVMVESGTVTLRGPVKNADEKARVEALAKNVTGVTAANNQLDMKSAATTQ